VAGEDLTTTIEHDGGRGNLTTAYALTDLQADQVANAAEWFRELDELDTLPGRQMDVRPRPPEPLTIPSRLRVCDDLHHGCALIIGDKWGPRLATYAPARK
jgi:hypothetical protein